MIGQIVLKFDDFLKFYFWIKRHGKNSMASDENNNIDSFVRFQNNYLESENSRLNFIFWADNIIDNTILIHVGHHIMVPARFTPYRFGRVPLRSDFEPTCFQISMFGHFQNLTNITPTQFLTAFQFLTQTFQTLKTYLHTILSHHDSISRYGYFVMVMWIFDVLWFFQEWTQKIKFELELSDSR